MTSFRHRAKTARSCAKQLGSRVLRSLYLPDSGVDGKCLTDQPNPSAPQEGVHVYQFVASLCSRKVRVMLALKGVAYESHHVVLPA